MSLIRGRQKKTKTVINVVTNIIIIIGIVVYVVKLRVGNTGNEDFHLVKCDSTDAVPNANILHMSPLKNKFTHQNRKKICVQDTLL